MRRSIVRGEEYRGDGYRYPGGYDHDKAAKIDVEVRE